MERVTGIEPAQLAWKARTLPLSYTRKIIASSAIAVAKFNLVCRCRSYLITSVRRRENHPLDFQPSGRSVVASAPALGAGDRGFESLRPDQKEKRNNYLRELIIEKRC
jgi:hypothetical protein